MITSQAVSLDTAVLQFISVIVEVSILLLEDRLGMHLGPVISLIAIPYESNIVTLHCCYCASTSDVPINP